MNRQPTPMLGAASLVTAFSLLLLTMLSLLSLTQAKADRRIADISAAQVREAYAADLEAQKIYAQIRSGEIPADVREEDGICSFQIPVSQYQTLFVEIHKETQEVIRWQTVSHPEEPNENLSVWKGQ